MTRRWWVLSVATIALIAQAAGNVSGKWHCVLQTEDGERVIEPIFRQDGEKMTGKWRDGDVKGTFSNGKLNVEIPVTSEEAGPRILKLKGDLAGEALEGEWTFQDYKGTFRATRLSSGESPAPSESHSHS